MYDWVDLLNQRGFKTTSESLIRAMRSERWLPPGENSSVTRLTAKEWDFWVQWLHLETTAPVATTEQVLKYLCANGWRPPF